MAIPRLTDQPGAIALAAQIRAGDLSPREAVEAAIARIEDRDMPIDAVVVCDFERARTAAEALDGQVPDDDRPLFGVPMTIKESFDIAGLPTCWGHERFADNIARRDSFVVERLKAAGAIFLGKTNVPPDLADWQSRNPVYGRTRNPHDTARTPGGSSGGAAAAVASGMVPCEYGSDIGGSIRVPAHFCGVWGHKASWGLVPMRGHAHPMLGQDARAEVALGVAGPIARNAEDLALLLRLTATMPLAEQVRPLAGCRMLLVADYPGSPVDDAVRGPVEAAADALQGAGVQIARSSDLLPDLAAQQRSYMKMLNIALARGMPGPDGKRASASDWFDLLDAQARCEEAWRALFEVYDFVLAPPAPVLALPHGEGRVFDGKLTINGREEDAGAALAWAGLATFPNLPSTVLPVGESHGLPCGMQVIGPRWHDLGCIAAARAIGDVLHG